jgi:hypothetical protein
MAGAGAAGCTVWLDGSCCVGVGFAFSFFEQAIASSATQTRYFPMPQDIAGHSL